MHKIERLLELEVDVHGNVTEVIELICTMTGFRKKYMTVYSGDGDKRTAHTAYMGAS